MKKSNSLVKLFCLVVLISLLAFALKGNAQTPLSNYSFNTAVSYPISSQIQNLNLSNLSTSSETFISNSNGTPTSTGAFVQNAIGGQALQMNNSSGNSRFFEFEVLGSNMEYSSLYKLYFQSKASNSVTSLDVSFSLDGTNFTHFSTEIVSTNYQEHLLDLTSINSLDFQPHIYFKLTALNSSASGTLNIDNFQIASELSPIYGYSQRSLYVDNFYKYVTGHNSHLYEIDYLDNILSSGAFDAGTMLFSKEKELLEFCKSNHITHLMLYDMKKLFIISGLLNPRGENGFTSLCRFMTQARLLYGIESFGASVSSNPEVDDILTDYNPAFGPLVLNSSESSRISNASLQSALQTPDYLITDPFFKKYIRLLRFAVLFQRFNETNSIGSCPDFSSFVIEIEYWNSGFSWTDFTTLVNHIKSICPLPVEAYTSRFTTSPGATTEASYYDGAVGNPKNVDRTLSVTYNWQTEYIEHPHNFPSEAEKNNNLKLSSNKDGSEIVPLFSAQSTTISADGNGIDGPGRWIVDPYRNAGGNLVTTGGIDPIISRNIFQVERYFYDDWRRNINISPPTNLAQSSENLVRPGATSWFASRFILKDFKDPVIFYRDGYFGCETSATSLTFKYCGPIDPNTEYTFTLDNSSNSTHLTLTGSISDLTLNNYATDHPDVVSPLVFNGISPSTTPYIATMTLNYKNNDGTSPQSYTYSSEVYVGALKIAGEHPDNYYAHILCQGDPKTLIANYNQPGSVITWHETSNPGVALGTGTYLRINKLDPSNPPVAPQLPPGQHSIYYTISPPPACGQSNDVYGITIKSNPQFTNFNPNTGQNDPRITVVYNNSIFPPTIKVGSSYTNATYTWSDGLFTAERIVPYPDYVTIKIDNEGGCYRSMNLAIVPEPTITITPVTNCNNTVTVNNIPTSGSPSYKWFKYEPITQVWTLLALSGSSVTLPMGHYGCIVSVNLGGTYPRSQFSTFTLGTAPASVSVEQPGCSNFNLGSIVLSPSGATTGFTYSWNPASAGSSSSATNLIPGNYTCTITNGSACPSTISVSLISTNTCDGQSLHLCDQATISSVLSIYLPGESVAIHGTIFIDHDFIFSGSDITLDPGSKIIVNDGINFTITNNCTLRACTGQWYGIVLVKNQSLPAPSLTVDGNSILEDAQVAIDVSGDALYHIVSSHFLHNDISIKLADGSYSGQDIWGNEFKYSNGSLYEKTAIQHIEVDNSTNVQIGKNGSDPNKFSHAYYGVNVLDSYVTLQNNEFFDLGTWKYDDGYNWVMYGSGVLTAANNYSNLLVEGTNASSNQNYFHNLECDGVSVIGNVDLDVHGNLFENLKGGIEFTSIYNHSNPIDARTAIISMNIFRDYIFGVSGTDMNYATVTIDHNQFDMDHADAIPSLSLPINHTLLSKYGVFAIGLQNYLGNSEMLLDCEYNWISGTKCGVLIRNIEAVNPHEVKVQHNQSFFTKPSEKISGGDKGIWVENCKWADVNNNHIEAKISATYDYGSLQIPSDRDAMHIIGIEIDASSNCQITENYLGSLGYGMRATYDCSNSELHCNNFDDFNTGVNFHKCTFTDQGDFSSGTSFSNEWNGTQVGPYILSGDVAAGFKWAYVSGTNTTPTAPPNLLLFISIDASTEVSLNDPNCSVPNTNSQIAERDKLFQNIVFNYNSYNSDPLYHDYYAKLFYYLGISKDPSLLNLGAPDDIVYQTFFQTLAQSNVGEFKAIDELIRSGSLSEALNRLSQLIDENVLEQNKKIVEMIMVQNKISGEELTASQKSILEPIAYENGIYGGEATYIARALLKLYIDDASSNLRLSAPQFYTHKADPKPDSGVLKFQLVPNPASSEFSIFILKNLGEKSVLEVHDCFGKCVLSQNLSSNEAKSVVNVTNLQAGVYYVSLIQGNNYIETRQLVVVH